MRISSKMKLFLITALLLVAFAIVVASRPMVSSDTGPSGYAGMGDLHRYEAEQASSTNTGSGDVQGNETHSRFIPITGAPSTDQAYAGMGDLHRYEAEQESQKVVGGGR